MRDVTLALEDGTVFRGKGFGAKAEAAGEVVFNTALSGYQEVLTDPSYCGQIVTMTYPEIGNYGIAQEDMESGKIQVEGFVVRNLSPVASSWRGGAKSLDAFLSEQGIPGVSGIDTRMLVRILRTKGAQRGVILDGKVSENVAVEKARQVPSIVGIDMVCRVTSKEAYDWSDPTFRFDGEHKLAPESERPLVVAYDFGIKRNILRLLVTNGFRVRVVPAGTPASEVEKLNPAGVFLSNGPGDPDAVPYAIAAARELSAKFPIFGICLGHQILGLALGAKTYKLKFGHRGANHPVQELPSMRVEVSSQNHGFAVDAKSLPSDLEVSHINLNDQTVSGMRHKSLPLFSVQYHPEASPGPHDSEYLFKQFVEAVRTRAAVKVRS
ncbi:MAG TPA: glutamine-hydrolyzing carbamoyl-phosphate synthase small subunit [Fibrobacteria bacterium]|nr:glutamine-hydrolyzing carbamoyl-phosphate synthase small subunit [Fibrobacteria bacterium]